MRRAPQDDGACLAIRGLCRTICFRKRGDHEHPDRNRQRTDNPAEESPEASGGSTGREIVVAELPSGRLVMSARPTGKISDVFGLLKKKDGPSLSIEDINRIAAEGWAGKR